ncbi:unnamed protein product, partial [Amoebophrya sp. A25]
SKHSTASNSKVSHSEVPQKNGDAAQEQTRIQWEKAPIGDATGKEDSDFANENSEAEQLDLRSEGEEDSDDISVEVEAIDLHSDNHEELEATHFDGEEDEEEHTSDNISHNTEDVARLETDAEEEGASGEDSLTKGRERPFATQ